MRAITIAGRLEDLRWPNFSKYRVEVEELYRRSNFKPVWIRAGQPTAQAKQMIAVLQHADDDGLRAEDYDSSHWLERLVRLAGHSAPSDEARFDAALTVCTMRYVSDLRVGRVDPRYFKPGLDVSPKNLDLATFVRNRLANGTDLNAEITRIQPPLPGYSRLRKALARYIQLAKEDGGERLPVPHGVVLAGQQYQGAQRLANLLRLVGDLPDDTVLPANSILYDAPLVEAVKRFQQRHGLPPDGRLDADTLDQLNVPLSERVEQIRMALERYRWLNYELPQPPLIINIPEFRLYALNHEYKAALTMTVDVGQDYNDTRTPVLESNIEYLIFRPYWDVPFDIQRDEIVPEIEQYSDYLSGFGFEVVTPEGKLVTDGTVSKEVLERIRTGQLRIRQKPGRDNSLGRVKFVFPNRYSVYLHDTPSWGEYFSHSDRAVSHGCIHVKQPAQLAAWMLRDKPQWTLAKVQHAMTEGPDNVRVNLTKPLPVLIVYLTAVAREDGTVYFYSDIYGYDAELQQALAQAYPHA